MFVLFYALGMKIHLFESGYNSARKKLNILFAYNIVLHTWPTVLQMPCNFVIFRLHKNTN